jgi:WD40 repeat protein
LLAAESWTASTSSRNDHVSLWDVTSGLKLVSSSETTPAPSPDGQWLVRPDGTGGELLEGRTFGARRSLRHPGDHLSVPPPFPAWEYPTARFSPDSKMVLLSGLEQERRRLALSEWRSGRFDRVCWAEDESIARLWDVRTGAEAAAFEDCTEGLFSPDGKTLATVHGDGTIQIWDVPPRRPLLVTLGLTACLWSILLFGSALVRKLVRRRGPERNPGK